MIKVTNNTIEIEARYFAGQESGFSDFDKDILSDAFEKIYTNQQIIINASDGENIERCGLIDYLEWACQEFNIPHSSIFIITPNTKLISKFVSCVIPLHIFNSAKYYITQSFERQSNTKFVGASIGRFSPSRFRLIYELDQAFTNDTFLIFHPLPESVKKFYTNTNDTYKKELSWLESKKFDIDLVYPSELSINAIEWKDSYNNYHNIWNKFDIEIVAETDPNSNFWFTEKTARCIATGKPFLLLSGCRSLKILQDRGYTTFDEIIDESYDNETIPTRRISKIISSLTELYQSPDRASKINQLYQIAQHNITHYKKNVPQ
jgi:hypothetical protein